VKEQVSILDIGTALRVEVQENNAAIDVSTSTARSIELTKPDGTIESKTAAYVTDGTDGQIEYITLAGDIDQRGRWQYRAKVEFGAAQVFHTKPASFNVTK